LIEAKHGATKLSKHLACFQQQTGARHAFQVSMQAEYVDGDCFEEGSLTEARGHRGRKLDSREKIDVRRDEQVSSKKFGIMVDWR